MDLPAISNPAQNAILALVCLEHMIAILLFLTNFPLDLPSLRSATSQPFVKLVQIINTSKKKQADEEAISAAPADYNHHQQQQPRFPSEAIHPRWPFQSSITSILSPRSTHASMTPTPSTWNTSVIRRRFGSDATTSPTPVAATPLASARDRRTETAYTTSVSLSPYPNVTPTPMRRFMRAEGVYTPSVYPPLESVKRDWGREMVSPSIYSPVSEIGGRGAGDVGCGSGEREDDGAIVGASRDVAGAGDSDGVKSGVTEQGMLNLVVAKPIRPRRYFDPRREFETITPESLEKGSIVIGLGGGLSPLVGTGGARDGLRSVSELGEEFGLVANVDGVSSVYSRALAGGAESEKTREGLEIERFATPMSDDDGDRKTDHQCTPVLDAARDEDQPVPLLGFLDRAIAAIAYLLASSLDDVPAQDAESGLLVRPRDLSGFLIDN